MKKTFMNTLYKDEEQAEKAEKTVIERTLLAVQNVCKSMSSCTACPFCDENGNCILREKGFFPIDWSL